MSSQFSVPFINVLPVSSPLSPIFLFLALLHPYVFRLTIHPCSGSFHINISVFSVDCPPKIPIHAIKLKHAILYACKHLFFMHVVHHKQVHIICILKTERKGKQYIKTLNRPVMNMANIWLNQVHILSLFKYIEALNLSVSSREHG